MKKTFFLLSTVLMSIVFGTNYVFAKTQIDSYQLIGTTRCDMTGFYFANLNLLSNNTQVASLTQGLYPSGPVPGVCYYGGDLGFSCSVTNIVSDNAEYYLVNYICHASSYYNFNYRDGYIDGGFFLPKSEYDLCPLGMEFCDGTSPTTLAPTPTSLGQWIEMPDPENSEGDTGAIDYKLAREKIGLGKDLGYKIGHFQSGSGIILTATVNNPTNNPIQLVFTVTGTGTGTNANYNQSFTGTEFTTGTGEVTVPDLPAGDYMWKVKTIGTGLTDSVEVSHTSDTSNPDFAIFDGFEPYPYGYKFYNDGVTKDLITGGIAIIKEGFGIFGIPTYKKVFVGGYKWDIFNTTFDTSNLKSDAEFFDAFENIGLSSSGAFNGGNCVGLALSAAMKYKDSPYLQQNYVSFVNQIGESGIWNKVPSFYSSTGANDWDIYDDVFMKTVLSLQWSQKTVAMRNISNYLSQEEPIDILQRYKSTPDKSYIIVFSGTGSNGVEAVHAVVPYKVEGNRIYIWDNNIQYPKRENYLAYDQYIEINSNSDWKVPFYSKYQDWKGFTDMILIDVDTIFPNNKKSFPIGFNDTDISYSLLGNASLYVTNSSGDISGYKDGNIYRQIPTVDIVFPIGITLSGSNPDNNFKQLYLPQKMDGLTLHIDGTTDERYTLMIAGGDYYQKLEGVSTSSGQTDTFTTTGTGLTINFDDTKTGTYSLLMDNFHDYGTGNNGTGTVYIDSANVIPQPQQYSIDWNKVVQNTSDATQHTIDTNNDGVIGDSGDTTTNLPPVFQDITPPTTTATLTGTLVLNSTGSYYDTATITLNATDSIINNMPGSGVEKIYYSINTGSILTYTGSITLTNTGTTTRNYTLNYYSVDKFNNTEPTKTILFSITKTPTQIIPTYTFPTQTIPYNSGQQTAISSRYTVVGNVSGYTWGQNIAFTTGGQGTPTVQTTNGNRATSGNFQGGLNIQMNVPPRGETYTGYVYFGTGISQSILAFTVKRDSAPPSDVGTLDFGTKTVNYNGTVVSNWYTFPFLPDPTAFTITGSGNPTVQTSNGTRSTTGTVSYGTNIQAEIPAVGQTRVIEFTILGKTGKFTIKRQ